jgi:hypothetical protein
MINIFEVFLPQLLRYPNPTDPLNGEAAAMLMRDPPSYEQKVKGRGHDYNSLPALVSCGLRVHMLRDRLRSEIRDKGSNRSNRR